MTLPPYAALLGLYEAEAADTVLVMPFGDDVLGRPGFLHGGAIGGLLEMVAIVTLHRALDDDAVTIKPVNLSIDYLRGGRDADTRASASIRRLGTRVAHVEAVAWQEDIDRPIAIAHQTFLLRR